MWASCTWSWPTMSANSRINANNTTPVCPIRFCIFPQKRFAQYAGQVYTANGIHAHILPEDSPLYYATPELSLAIRLLKAHGGLNISASHNPPDDNGGKFYDERGGQPVPPDDQIMADLVEQVEVIKELTWPEAVRSGRIHFLDDGPHKAYLALIRKQSLVQPPRFDEIQVVFTPLQGVGSMGAMAALVDQGFPVRPVESQLKPDGQFTHVTKSPNPEVPESMDQAKALAEELRADLVLATDPDADRLGGMVPDHEGKFQILNGNQIAALLTHFKLAKLMEQGRMPRQPIVIKTLVTTGQITHIARHFNAQIVDNLLVGFKYIAEVLWQLELNGAYEDVQGTPEDFVIGCEESHGILVTNQIHDKDAAGAALLLAELALDLKRQGRNVLDYLHDLEQQFGYYRNGLKNIVLPGIEGKQLMSRMLERLRRTPPQTLGGLDVTLFEDLQNEEGWMGPFKGGTDKAARNFLVFHLGHHARIALRPSGTEPKAKAYIEVSSPPRSPQASAADWQAVKAKVDATYSALADDFARQIAPG